MVADFSSFLEAAVHQAHAQLGERLDQRREGVLRGLQLQRLGLLDQRAHPVGLAALQTGRAHARDDLVTTHVGDQAGADRRAPGRQLVEHRHVEIGVVGHRQRARDRRRRHHQHVRPPPALALLAQRQALAHAEAVLLVDHHERQPRQRHRVLDERMGADREQHLAARQAGELGLARALPAAARQPGDADAQRLQPGRELLPVLLCEDLGGRHHRRLPPVLGRLQHRQRGDQGLARADIALQQALHRMRRREVGGDLRAHPRLRPRGTERQRFEQSRGQQGARRQRHRRLGTAREPGAAQRELLHQQLLELHALPGGMLALLEREGVGVGRGMVQRMQGLGEAGQPQAVQPGGRQQFVERLALQRLCDQLAQGDLADAGGGGIDRGERIGQRLAGRHGAQARMHHLEPEEAAARLAEQAHAPARRERFLLRGVEVEPARHQGAAVVGDPRHQLAARTQHHLATEHLALDLGGKAGAQPGNRGQPGLVLVAQRQVEQDIAWPAQVEPGQPPRQLRPDPRPAARRLRRVQSSILLGRRKGATGLARPPFIGRHATGTPKR
jgi:hypothetical protein